MPRFRISFLCPPSVAAWSIFTTLRELSNYFLALGRFKMHRIFCENPLQSPVRALLKLSSSQSVAVLLLECWGSFARAFLPGRLKYSAAVKGPRRTLDSLDVEP